MTVGDTVTAGLSISNYGNQDLFLHALELPSAGLAIDRNDFPINIEPGLAAEFQLLFTPETPISKAEQIVIHSNDPLTPLDSIPVYLEVLNYQMK